MAGVPLTRAGTVTHVFVKICGVTSEEDALLAVAMGTDAIGFNFVPGSPRQVTPTAVRDIVRRLPTEPGELRSRQDSR